MKPAVALFAVLVWAAPSFAESRSVLVVVTHDKDGKARVPNLPPAFVGKTVAVLADLHHGPFVGIDFIRDAVRLTNSLAPDLITLVGDYAHKGVDAHTQLQPCLEALSALTAPLGVFAVPGNH